MNLLPIFLLGSSDLQSADTSAVFRRGGILDALLRHGSHVRNVGSHESRALQVISRLTRASFSFCPLHFFNTLLLPCEIPQGVCHGAF